MKVAILTQPLGKNYGGIIQNYALQVSISKLGGEPITLQRVHSKPSMVKLAVRLILRFLKRLKGSWKAPLYVEKHQNYFYKNTHHFIEQYINISKPIDNSSDLKNEFEQGQFLAVVVGSDQTWRPMYSPDIANYFLDFVEQDSVIKVAYASSFGVDVWEYDESKTLQCAELVKKFDAVAVREVSGVALCEKYLGIHSEHVLDPTLLLTKEEYTALIEGYSNNKYSDGIFTYWLDKNSTKLSATTKIAKNLGLVTYTCYSHCSPNDMSSSNLDDYVLPPLQEWLSSFADAKLVLTDSFHGMVFSIIFEKEFFVVANKSRGASRFESLLRDLNLSDRLLNDASLLEEAKNKSKPIDYATVNQKLGLLRESSLAFLNDSIFGKLTEGQINAAKK